jgi:hypothetical protein
MPRDSLIPRLLDESPKGVILYQPGLTAKPEAQVGRSPNQGGWAGASAACGENPQRFNRRLDVVDVAKGLI